MPIDETNETPQEIIEQTKEKIIEILKKDFTDYYDFEDGSYSINYGSTQVKIIVRPFTKEEASVECISNVVTGAKINEDVLRFLLRSNSDLHFGAFGLTFDDTITFSHAFTSSCLGQGELQVTVATVAAISDFFDDQIVEMAGGKRAIDLTEEPD